MVKIYPIIFYWLKVWWREDIVDLRRKEHLRIFFFKSKNSFNRKKKFSTITR